MCESSETRQELIEENTLLKQKLQELEQLKAELKRLKEELGKEQEILRTSQRLAKVGGWAWDIVAQTMSWTDETYRIHDMDPSELPPGSLEHSQRSLACYDPQDRAIIWKAFQLCAQHGEPYDMEFPFTSAKGRRLWIRTAGKAIMDHGRVVKVIGTLMDITDRVRAEEALRQSQKQFRAIADYTPDLEVWIGPDGKFLWINPMVVDFSGYTTEEIMAMPNLPMALIVETDRPRVARLFMEALQHGTTGNTECEFICKTGERKWVEVYWRPINDEKGRSLGLRAGLRDVTARKRMEEEREKLLYELKEAIVQIKTLKGLLPICAYCKKIRNDKGDWEQFESYVRQRSDVEFSHGICPECTKKMYAEINENE